MAAAAVLAALLAAHTTAWVMAQRRVAASFREWADAQRAQGATVAYDESATGWPFSAGIAARRLTIGGPGFAWSAERADVTVRALDPFHVHLTPRGEQTVQSGGIGIHARAASLDLALRLPAGDEPALSATTLVVDTAFGPLTTGRLTARATLGHQPDTPALSVALAASTVQLPPGPSYPLGPDIQELAADITLTGYSPAAGPLRQQAAAWRDNGGTARLSNLRLVWGNAALDGEGALALDRNLQPVADLQLQLHGQNEMLDAMAGQGFITVRSAAAAKAVLGLFARARPGPDGQPARLPVTLRDGAVSLAGFAIARLPPLDWQ